MAKLPDTFSLQAIPIRSALAEGRTEDARTIIVAILRAGKADAVVQGLAADLLKPAPRSRGRQKAVPRHWHEIGVMFNNLREDASSYEEALADVARHFGYSETHIRNAVAAYDAAKAEHDDATRN